jgi:hypothetical protein
MGGEVPFDHASLRSRHQLQVGLRRPLRTRQALTSRSDLPRARRKRVQTSRVDGHEGMDRGTVGRRRTSRNTNRGCQPNAGCLRDGVTHWMTVVVNDEVRLREKLRSIEALFAGATSNGERDAADRARDRIAARLRGLEQEKSIEWQFSLNPWSHRLLIALARRYGLKPYRYRRQRHLTLVLRAPERFLRETFLPEYDEMVKTLNEHLTEVTERVVADVLNADRSDPTIEDEPRQLSFGPTRELGPQK